MSCSLIPKRFLLYPLPPAAGGQEHNPPNKEKKLNGNFVRIMMIPSIKNVWRQTHQTPGHPSCMDRGSLFERSFKSSMNRVILVEQLFPFRKNKYNAAIDIIKILCQRIFHLFCPRSRRLRSDDELLNLFCSIRISSGPVNWKMVPEGAHRREESFRGDR